MKGAPQKHSARGSALSIARTAARLGNNDAAQESVGRQVRLRWLFDSNEIHSKLDISGEIPWQAAALYQLLQHQRLEACALDEKLRWARDYAALQEEGYDACLLHINSLRCTLAFES